MKFYKDLKAENRNKSEILRVEDGFKLENEKLYEFYAPIRVDSIFFGAVGIQFDMEDLDKIIPHKTREEPFNVSFFGVYK